MDTVEDISKELSRLNCILHDRRGVAERTYNDYVSRTGVTPEEYETAALRYLKLRNATVSIGEAVSQLEWFCGEWEINAKT